MHEEDFPQIDVPGASFPGIDPLEQGAIQARFSIIEAVAAGDRAQQLADRVTAMGELMTGGPEKL